MGSYTYLTPCGHYRDNESGLKFELSKGHNVIGSNRAKAPPFWLTSQRKQKTYILRPH